MSRFLNIILYLESQGIFDPLNEAHLFALHLVYIDLINDTLQNFVSQWNHHPVTTESNLSPQQLWIKGMVTLQNAGYSAVDDVVDNVSSYGLDMGGPVPEEDESRRVCVPNTSINIDMAQLGDITNAVKESQENGDVNGIQAYVLALQLLNAGNNSQ